MPHTIASVYDINRSPSNYIAESSSVHALKFTWRKICFSDLFFRHVFMMIWAKLKCYFHFSLFCAAQSTYLQLLTPQKNSDSLFQCLVKQALKRPSRYHREGVQWQLEKSAIIYVSTPAMWEDKFIDILMIILDHSPLHPSTATQHILVSSRARLMSNLSRKESSFCWH